MKTVIFAIFKPKIYGKDFINVDLLKFGSDVVVQDILHGSSLEYSKLVSTLDKGKKYYVKQLTMYATSSRNTMDAISQINEPLFVENKTRSGNSRGRAFVGLTNPNSPAIGSDFFNDGVIRLDKNTRMSLNLYRNTSVIVFMVLTTPLERFISISIQKIKSFFSWKPKAIAENEPVEDIENEKVDESSNDIELQLEKECERQPLIIKVTNNTDAPISNVEVLNARERQDYFDFEEKCTSEKEPGLEYVYAIPGINYKMFILSLISEALFMFRIVTLRIIATHVSDTSIAENQAKEVVTISDIDVSTYSEIDTFPNEKSVFNVENQINTPCNFNLTETVSLKIASIAPRTTVKIMMFPK